MTTSSAADLSGDRCGHPCKGDGRPCTRHKMGGYSTCRGHLTKEQRSRCDAELEQSCIEEAERIKRFEALVPFCWELQVSQDDRRIGRETSEEEAPLVLENWQQDRCAICGRCAHLIVDHDHETGLIRGMLCQSCNTRESTATGYGGPFRKYRERSPAAILGIRARYWSPFGGWAKPRPKLSNVDRWTDNALIGIGL